MIDLTGYSFSVQVLYESFDEPFEGRWIVSKNGDYEGNCIPVNSQCIVVKYMFCDLRHF